MSPARQTWEVRDGADDRTTIVLSEIARAMRRRGPRGAPAPNPPQTLHVTLRDGFRGHAVTIAVNGREAYRRIGVTTDPTTSQADEFEWTDTVGMASVAVSVTPGDYAASLDVEVARHRHLAISLVGEGTISFETSAHPFRFT